MRRQDALRGMYQRFAETPQAAQHCQSGRALYENPPPRRSAVLTALLLASKSARPRGGDKAVDPQAKTGFHFRFRKTLGDFGRGN